MTDTMNKVVCPVCGQEFETQEEHDKHHRQAHGEEQPE
jgi:hypothetical protein